VCTLTVVVAVADDNEYNLVRDIMRNYDYRIIPTRNSTEALNVSFSVALSQIIDVVSARTCPPPSR